MFVKLYILVVIGALWVLFCAIEPSTIDARGTQDSEQLTHQERLDYLDYEWLAEKLRHNRTVSTKLLLRKFGKPRSTQKLGVGEDICWYYECIGRDGVSRKLQIVVSDGGVAKRTRLYESPSAH